MRLFPILQDNRVAAHTQSTWAGLEPALFSVRSPFCDYAFDVGIVTLSFGSEGQGLSVSHSISNDDCALRQIHQKVYLDTTFGGCAFPS